MKILADLHVHTISSGHAYSTLQEYITQAKRIGWKVALGTDSHISTILGEFSWALKVAKEAGLEKEDIVNTSEKLIEKHILSKTLNAMKSVN